MWRASRTHDGCLASLLRLVLGGAAGNTSAPTRKMVPDAHSTVVPHHRCQMIWFGDLGHVAANQNQPPHPTSRNRPTSQPETTDAPSAARLPASQPNPPIHHPTLLN